MQRVNFAKAARQPEMEEGGEVEIPKQQVLEFVEGGPSAFERADDELPDYVDSERDEMLLMGLGINVQAMLGQLNGRAHR
jgi:hypothetical protein